MGFHDIYIIVDYNLFKMLQYVLLSFLDPGIWVFELGRAVQYIQMMYLLRVALTEGRIRRCWTYPVR